MEYLVQEQYMTAFTLLFFSFLVAKFVVIAISANNSAAGSDLGHKSCRKFEGITECKVKGTKSSRRVRFADEVVIIYYDKHDESEEFIENRYEFVEICDGEDEFCDEGERDEDWEEIERSELENYLARAVNCVDDNLLMSIGSNLQKQFYGIERLGIEGPCYEAQYNMPLMEGLASC